VPEVRLVGEDGKQIGVIKTSEALAYAQERDLDLVEVAPDARPPVCRVLDYSKYKYEQAQKQKAARKHQQQITIREIKFRPKIAQNDYDTKKGHVRRFLKGKDRVKVTIMFRGREVTHPERGTALLEKLATELADVALVEQTPLQDGRNMTMMLAPSKSVLSEDEHETPKDAAAGTSTDANRTKATTAEASPAEGSAAPAGPAAATPAEGSAAPAGPAAATPAEDSAAPAGPAAATPAEDSAAPAGPAAATPAEDSAESTSDNGHQNGAADEAAPTPSDAPA
jgi:translation initiation factor IF-3